MWKATASRTAEEQAFVAPRQDVRAIPNQPITDKAAAIFVVTKDGIFCLPFHESLFGLLKLRFRNQV